jgi:hypothetical protein
MIPDDDAGLLAAIREVFGSIDPMPADLPERIRFSLALHDLDAEVARFASPDDELALAARGPEESRTITFDSDSLTIMIRIDHNLDGTVRIDGWLAPPCRSNVEMQLAGTSVSVTADEAGRFVFSGIPRGTARVVVHAAGSPEGEGRGDGHDGPLRSVITPALILLAGTDLVRQRRDRKGAGDHTGTSGASRS